MKIEAREIRVISVFCDHLMKNYSKPSAPLSQLSFENIFKRKFVLRYIELIKCKL